MSTTISDSNFGRLAYIAESSFGITPATPAMQILRVTSSDFGSQKETAISDELRSDRMVSTMAETAAMSSGSLNYELSLGGSFDPLIEAALCGTLTTAVNASNVAVTAGNVFTLVGAFTNVVVGQWVFAGGFTNAANNGWHRVTVTTANAITVASTLVVEVAAVGKTVKGRMVRNGVVKRSYTIEEAMLDINQFFAFRGMRLGTMSMDVQAGQIVTGSFGFQGTAGTVAGATISGSTPPATTTQIVNATSNVGGVFEDTTYTALTTAVQGFNFTLDNALRNQMAVGSKFPVGIGYGRQTVSGSLNAYFQSAALYNKFLNHTNSALSFGFTDLAGNALRVTFPRVFFTTSNPSLGGIDQDVMEQIDFQAVADPVTACQIQVDIVAA